MKRLLAPFLSLALLPLGAPVAAMSGSVPAGLPGHFAIGTQNFPGAPGNRAWMDATRSANNADWDYRYTYFSAGANTGSGWATWNSPAGQYATLYMNDSDAGGYIPVLVYYQILQSSPAVGADESAKDYNNLNNAATMNAYYADFKLLLQRVAAFNKPVIIHIEPDLFGYIQKDHSGGTNNAANSPAAVASSGHADVAGLPNTFQGYCRALRRLRDTYAPQARLAIHLSMWATARDLMADTLLSQADINTEVDKTVSFLNSCDSGAEGKFDLFFFEFSDRDASYKWSYGNTTYYWSDVATNVGGSPITFTRHRYILNRVSDGLGKRGMGWQNTVGNTVYQTCNNSSKHWRSPFAQGILEGYAGPAPASRIKDYANAGVIGMLFGAGQWDQTHPWDDAGDGVSNGANVANYGSTQGGTLSTVSDDDGGYLRYRVGNYYTQGVLPLSGAPSPTPTATPSPVQSPTPTPSATPDCPRALNLAESLAENGSWAGTGATRSLNTLAMDPTAVSQGNASLRVQVNTVQAWWNEGLANLSSFSPSALGAYSGISFDLYVDPASPPWSGASAVRNIAVHANSAAAAKWSQPITADSPLAAGLNRISVPFNFALGTILPSDAISTLQFNLKVDTPSTGVFYLDNIVLHTGAACPPSPTPTGTRTPTRSPSPSASPSATATASPTASRSASPTPSLTATLTASSTPTATPSSSPSASASRTASATASPSATPTETLSPAQSATASPTATPTETLSPAQSATASPSVTPTSTLSPALSATASPTATPTATLSPALSATASPTATPTATLSPAFSATASPTATPTSTLSPALSATASPTATPTATASPAQSATASPSASATATLSATPMPGAGPPAAAPSGHGRLLEAVPLPNPLRAAAVQAQGLRFALKVEGQPRALQAALYTRAMVRVGGWEQALTADPAPESWKRAQSPGLALAAGAYFARFESEGSSVLCRFVVLP